MGHLICMTEKLFREQPFRFCAVSVLLNGSELQLLFAERVIRPHLRPHAQPFLRPHAQPMQLSDSLSFVEGPCVPWLRANNNSAQFSGEELFCSLLRSSAEELGWTVPRVKIDHWHVKPAEQTGDEAEHTEQGEASEQDEVEEEEVVVEEVEEEEDADEEDEDEERAPGHFEAGVEPSPALSVTLKCLLGSGTTSEVYEGSVVQRGGQHSPIVQSCAVKVFRHEHSAHFESEKRNLLVSQSVGEWSFLQLSLIMFGFSQ